MNFSNFKMKINLKRLLFIASYIAVFTIIFNDWLFGVGIGTGLGVALTDDDSDKKCCK